MVPHSATHYSLYYLVFMKRPHLPIDITLEAGCTEAYGTYHEYCHNLETRWKQAKELALLNNRIAKRDYKRYYDRHLNSVPFKVGDKVLKQAPYTPAVRGKQFDSKWIGPYLLKSFVSEYVVMLELIRPAELQTGQRRTASKPIISHITKLKHHTASDVQPPINEPGPQASEPTSSVLTTIPYYSDDDERVLAVRKKRKTTARRKTATKRKPATKKKAPTKRPRATNQCLEKIIKELLKQSQAPARRTRRTAGKRSGPKAKEVIKRIEKLEEQYETLKKQVKDLQTIRSNLVGREQPVAPTELPPVQTSQANPTLTNPPPAVVNPSNTPPGAQASTLPVSGTTQSSAPSSTQPTATTIQQPAGRNQPQTATVSNRHQFQTIRYAVAKRKINSVEDVRDGSAKEKEVFEIIENSPTEPRIKVISLMSNKIKTLLKTREKIHMLNNPLYVGIKSAQVADVKIIQPGVLYEVREIEELEPRNPAGRRRKTWEITDIQTGDVNRIEAKHHYCLCPVRPSTFDMAQNASVGQ